MEKSELGNILIKGGIFIFVVLIIFSIGYYLGYTDTDLNIENGILFCESQDKKWCYQNSEEIACGYGECSLNADLIIYKNPELTIKDIRFAKQG